MTGRPTDVSNGPKPKSVASPTTSGSRTSMSALMSPPAHASMNRSDTARWLLVLDVGAADVVASAVRALSDGTARPARELTARGRRPSDGLADGCVGKAEDVVQDECGAFRGRKPVEHDRECELHLVVERDRGRRGRRRSSAGSEMAPSGKEPSVTDSWRKSAERMRSRHSRRTTTASQPR